MLATFFGGGATGTASAADGGIAPGQGLAIALTDRIDPEAGALSIGVTFGISIAGHQNSVAQASSQALDLGVIGTSLAAEGCDGSAPTLPPDKQPSAAQVDSREQNPTVDEDETTFPLPIHKHADATSAPFGEAITTTAPFSVIPGVLTVGGGSSHSTSGVVDNGATRRAEAIADISSINLGPVQLSGLHWDAVWDSTGQPHGLFTINNANINGQATPTNNPFATLDQANAALAPLGIKIDAPAIRTQSNAIYVDPLGISVVPSAQRDQVAAAVLGAVQPARQSLYDALLSAKCSTSTEITVSDIAIGSVTGAGSFNLFFGGVQAFSGEIAANQFCLGCNGPLGGSGPSSLGTGSSGGSSPLSTGAHPSTAATPTASPAAAPAAAPATRNVLPAAAIKPKGVRGGALAGIGLAALAAIALAAEGDRRKMRHAQRQMPQFAD